MAFAFRNAQNATGSPTVTLTKPTGTIDGDLIVVGLYGAGGGGSAPGGWTASETGTVSTGGRLSSFWKIASGEGASYAFTVVSGGLGIIMTFSGPDQNITLDQHSQNFATATTSLVATGVTTTYANDLQVNFYVPKVTAGTPTVTPPASRTEPTNGEVNSAGTSCLEMCYFISSSGSAGATGNQTATSSISADGYGAFLLTFLPFQPITPSVATASGSSVTPTVQAAANPAVAIATGAGVTPTVQANPSPATATATGASVTPVVQDRVSPTVATATASPNNPTVQAPVNPAVATATGASIAPTVRTLLNPAVTTATATAPAQTVRQQTSPTLATATATAFSPGLVTRVLPSVATATATALGPSVQISVTPATQGVTASAFGPTLRVLINPATATATGAGVTPTVRAVVQAPAGAATGASITPTVRIVINPTTATATITGLAPTAQSVFHVPTATMIALGIDPRIRYPREFMLHGDVELIQAIDGSVILKAHDINGNEDLDGALSGDIRLESP